jgi:16S rRNA (uracil1498-N3)-methyltransferase
VERGDQAPVATFFADAAVTAGSSLELDIGAAHHARVRRVQAGEVVTLTNGAGTLARGTVDRIGRHSVRVVVSDISRLAKPPSLAMLVPIADRDRMLWLAEKSAELAVSVWQPVIFRRSSSVGPRGAGDVFSRKVHARMVGALEQSGGAWLTEVRPELSLAEALDSRRDSNADRFLLDRHGTPLVTAPLRIAADVILGPEGGIENAERELIAHERGWVPASVGNGTLRFETAGIVAAGVLRARLSAASP